MASFCCAVRRRGQRPGRQACGGRPGEASLSRHSLATLTSRLPPHLPGLAAPSPRQQRARVSPPPPRRPHYWLNLTCAPPQTMSGTGACSLAGSFFAKFIPGIDTIYVPNPTWGNHHNIFRQVTPIHPFHAASLPIRLSGILGGQSTCRNGHPRAVLPRAHSPSPQVPSHLTKTRRFSSAGGPADHPLQLPRRLRHR